MTTSMTERPLDLSVRGPGMGFQRVVVPVDPSGRAGDAFDAAAQSVDPVWGRVRLVHVRAWHAVPPPSREEACLFYEDAELFPETSEQAAKVVERAVVDFGRRGVDVDGVVVEAHRSRVGAAIATMAAAWDAELIVLCRRPRRRLSVWLWGSVSEQVLAESPCPVLVVRETSGGNVSWLK